MLKALQWYCRKYDIYISYNITGEILGRLEIKGMGTACDLPENLSHCLLLFVYRNSTWWSRVCSHALWPRSYADFDFFIRAATQMKMFPLYWNNFILLRFRIFSPLF